MTNEQLWQTVLGEMELALSKANFVTWFKDTFVAEQNNNKIVVCVPNVFTKNWFEAKYHQPLLKILKRLFNDQNVSLEYRLGSKKQQEKLARNVDAITPKAKLVTVNPAKDKEKIDTQSNLNPKYAFNNFIVGKGNELAQAASLAAARKPGEVYNPLFIYGGAGLGKTHLLHALGNEIKKNHPNLKVLYLPCERFITDFVNAIANNTVNDFKKIYRTPDVLIIDDIQFISGKEATQEELFHTFNELHQNNKQIVLSSDRLPKAIPALEKRLTTRFEWGMIADIALPDLETRMAILEYKCKERKFELNPDIIRFIATTAQNNVRELEGALNRIIALTQLKNALPSLQEIKAAVSSLMQTAKKSAITPKQILNITAEFFEIKLSDLTGACRKKELVVPRQIAMYLMREEIDASYPNIGQEMGGRDHTTAIHAYEKIKKLVDSNEKITEDVNLIKQRIYNQ